jgi:hypothetical protein
MNTSYRQRAEGRGQKAVSFANHGKPMSIQELRAAFLSTTILSV